MNEELEQRVVKALLEEACRQWCLFIDECPERRDGEGFFNFCHEIFEEKFEEYMQDITEQMKSEAYEFDMGGMEFD